MKAFMTVILMAALATLAGCGSSGGSGGGDLSSDHDGSYRFAVYNTEGRCITDGSEGVINVEEGVLIDSQYSNDPISGTVTSGNYLEGFMEFRGDTITFQGRFESTLSGTWRAEIGACSGFFEEVSREIPTAP